MAGFGKYSDLVWRLTEVVVDQKADFNGEGGES